MAQLRWAEILAQQTGNHQRHRKHHDCATTEIHDDAKDDLRRLHLDELFGDTMFRFRLSGTKRLWGFRNGRTFHVVWWDADHAVFPTEPG